MCIVVPTDGDRTGAVGEVVSSVPEVGYAAPDTTTVSPVGIRFGDESDEEGAGVQSGVRGDLSLVFSATDPAHEPAHRRVSLGDESNVECRLRFGDESDEENDEDDEDAIEKMRQAYNKTHQKNKSKRKPQQSRNSQYEKNATTARKKANKKSKSSNRKVV